MVLESHPPYPPFTRETAAAKVKAAEDAWNTRDPHRVAMAYTVDTVWRTGDTFVMGRNQVIEYLARTWTWQRDYALRENLWGFDGNRIGVRFQYEWHDTSGQWWRSYGSELWEFAENGLMARREASINDVRIEEWARRIFGPRPAWQCSAEFPLR